ncbi:hypothetical protein MUG91_G47n135 [Manis pentadactyla]|nr:hypothetical protein MUG91_G47n135 [Manis pentadactyla]
MAVVPPPVSPHKAVKRGFLGPRLPQEMLVSAPSRGDFLEVMSTFGDEATILRHPGLGTQQVPSTRIPLAEPCLIPTMSPGLATSCHIGLLPGRMPAVTTLPLEALGSGTCPLEVLLVASWSGLE